MRPAWIKQSDGDWTPGWLVDGSASGASEAYVLVALDDKPSPNWSYPTGSLALRRILVNNVRLRRTVIPLHDPVAHEGEQKLLPDAAKR